jgi:hypothetical protein
MLTACPKIKIVARIGLLAWKQDVRCDMKAKYRVHRFDLRMTKDQDKLELFLNSLEGEIIAIVPNINLGFLWAHRVDFLLIVEKVAEAEKTDVHS